MTLLHPLIAMLLTSVPSIPPVYGGRLASLPASSPASAPPGIIEVDVLFPIHNATYNITASLPIVFALQNLPAAAALGPFSFAWDIMPFGNVGEDQAPGGVTNDEWTARFVAANTTTEPYILVNQTDVQMWNYGPFYPAGSVYALQWYIQWDGANQPCDSDPLGVFGELFFNINIGDIEPDLENLVGTCAQLGGVYEFNRTATTLNSSTSCEAVVSRNGTGDPCAVTVDKAMVASIESAVQSLITASAAAAAWPSATFALPTTRHNIAGSSDVPLRYVVVAIFLTGLLRWCSGVVVMF
jgi:hypothetical protein